MVIYPVPVAVTQAKIQLVIDETAKAPTTIINSDVQDARQGSEAGRAGGIGRRQGLASMRR